MINTIVLKYKFSKICVLTNCKSADYQASKVVKNLLEINPNYSFYGICGPLTNKVLNGKFQNFTDFNNFKVDKPYFPYKNADINLANLFFYLPSIHQNIVNLTTMYKLSRTNFYDMFLENDTELILSFNNELFNNRLLLSINNYYSTHHLFRPPTLFFDRHNALMTYKHSEYLDNLFYRYKLDNVDITNFEFPGNHIGSQAVYDVISYLYSTDNKFKNYSNESSIYLSKTYQQELLEELVFKNRVSNRKSYEINNEDIVVFLSLGSNEEEIKFSTDLLIKSVRLFIKEITKKYKISASSIRIFGSIPEYINSNIINEINVLLKNEKFSFNIVSNTHEKYKIMTVI